MCYWFAYQPSSPPSSRLAAAPPLAALAPLRPDSGHADPGSEGGGEGEETLLWFCGQRGDILRIFRGCAGSRLYPPQLWLPTLSHWNMPFEQCLHFSQALAGQVPATLTESRKGRRGAGEGKVGVTDWRKGLENGLLRAI